MNSASTLELEAPVDLAALPEIARRIRAHLESLGVAPREAYAIDLAVEEFVGNTIRHGYADTRRAAGGIRLRVAVASNEVELAIEDDGAPFDPTAHPAPPRYESLESAEVGGRGVHMVRQVVRNMRYERTAGGNRVTLSVPRAD